MGKRINTKSKPEVSIINGIKVYVWEKECAFCHKKYTTSTRSQKFCCESCCKKAQKKYSRRRREYNSTKEMSRLSARSHALGVEVLNQLERLGLRSKVCECCGSTEELQVHHKNVNFLDNSPQNLQWLCNKCHSAEHSRISKELSDLDKVPQDLYTEEEWAIYSVILKK